MTDSRDIKRLGHLYEETIVFRVDGTFDTEAAILACPENNSVHPRHPELFVTNVRVQPNPEIDPNNNPFVKAFVTYAPKRTGLVRIRFSDGSSVEEKWVWDITSQQEHIDTVQSTDLAIHYPADSDAGLAIGFDGETVEGVDVYRPSISLRVSRMWHSVSIDDLAFLHAATNTINEFEWYGYLTGEVLYIGATVAEQPDHRVQVDYQFLISQQQPAFTVDIYNGTSEVIDLLPWDYLWYRWVDDQATKLDGNQVPRRQIESAHVNLVYDFLDFDLFGLIGPFTYDDPEVLTPFG
jgi:hypothetical protein